MQEERKRILNMVKEGKLTVNEALELLEQLGDKQVEEKQQQFNFQSEKPSVHFEEAKKDGYQYQDNYQSAKDKFFDFIDTAIKKIKDLELDFNFGKSVEITHTFEQNDVNLKRLNVDIVNGSVKLAPWEEKNVRVDCKVKMYRMDNETEAKHAFLKNVLFSIKEDILIFSTEQKWMKLDATLYIPKEQYDKIKIRMFNGEIQSENLHVDNFDSKIANGKIDLFNLTGRYVEAETANGKIDIRNGNIDIVDAETLNGAITLDGSFRDIDVQSFSGNVHCQINDLLCEKIEAKATTGGIRIYLPEKAPMRGEATTNLGNLNIDYMGLQIIEEKNDVVQKKVRFQPVDLNEKAIKIDVETTTGVIAIKRS